MKGRIKKSSDYENSLSTASVGEKIQDSDPLDIQSQIIDFGKKSDLKNEVLDTIDKAETTSQFIKLFNRNLAKRLEKVKQLKFDEPFTLRKQPQSSCLINFDELKSKPTDELTEIEIKQLYEYWTALKDVTTLKLETLTKDVEKISLELETQQEKIHELGEELKKKKSLETNKEKSDVLRKSEILELIQNDLSNDKFYDKEKLSKAISVFKTTLESGEQK